MECERFYAVLGVCRPAPIHSLLLLVRNPPGFGHSAMQETACRCARLPVVISSEPCDRVMAFDYQFLHWQVFFFIHICTAVAANTNGAGIKRTTRLGFRGPWLTVMRGIICEDSLFSFPFHGQQFVALLMATTKPRWMLLFVTLFQTLTLKIYPSIYFLGSSSLVLEAKCENGLALIPLN